MEPLKFAIIGCGRIAKNHVRPLTEIPGAKLVALCDLLEDRTRPYRETHGLAAYQNYHEMLQQEQIDVVSIMTPSGMHPDHAIDVMRRYKKHIVVEKPMALALTDVDRMQAVANARGHRLVRSDGPHPHP